MRNDLKRIIYDLGSNNGDDIPYYLMKSDLVVAVEANPVLCCSIEDRFRKDIAEGALVVECCVLTSQSECSDTPFFLHKTNHVLSQYPEPSPTQLSEFEKVLLPSKSILSIIQAHGNPYYIKIDIEHYDAEILRCLFSNGLFPPFISAEAHSIEILSLLVAEGRYDAFKLVDGQSVAEVYSGRRFSRASDGSETTYSFPYHSAGPFGDDIDGPWLDANNFFSHLAFKGLGWKDIHATNIRAPAMAPDQSLRDQFFDGASLYEILRMARQLSAPERRFLIRSLVKDLFANGLRLNSPIH